MSDYTPEQLERRRENGRRYYYLHKEMRNAFAREYSKRPEVKERAKTRREKNRTRPEIKFRRYQRDAKAKDREFTLSFELFEDLVTDNCYYCGCQPVDDLNGVDRIDSSLGYVEGNVVTCCPLCNSMKSDKSLDAFLEQCRKIASHLTGFQERDDAIAANNSYLYDQY